MARKMIPPIEKSLACRFPDVAKEWNEALNKVPATQVYAMSGAYAWFTCGRCHHSWNTRIANRTHNSAGCPGCYVATPVREMREDSLRRMAKANPIPDELARDWHPDNGDIEAYSSGSKENVRWSCHKCSREWSSRIARRSKCPACRRRDKSMAEKHPHLLEMWDYDKNDIEPEEVLQSSNDKFWWKCEKAHSYVRSLHQMVYNYNGGCCGECREEKKRTEKKAMEGEREKAKKRNRAADRLKEEGREKRRKRAQRRKEKAKTYKRNTESNRKRGLLA